MITVDFNKYSVLADRTYEKCLGKVVKVVGLTIESIGPKASLNDLCYIVSKDKKQTVMAEVVGFRENRLLLMPYGNVEGIGIGSTVESSKEPLKVFVGDSLLGKTLDGLGKPIDNSEVGS